ncbi:MAG: araC 2 [Verrucomicrobiaceae bacterium]|nr:araC 2 [Verrucomicrobiaceae bacterium]
MVNDASYPEVIFERLSEKLPDAHRSLLSSSRYRQYVFLYAGKGIARFDGRIEQLVPGTVLSIPSQAKCDLQFDKKVDGVWIALLEEFQISLVIPALPNMLKPRSPFWTLYYKVSMRTEMTGAAQRKVRMQVMNDLLSARFKLELGADPVVVGYMQVALFAPSLGALNETQSPTEDTFQRADVNDLVLAFRQLIEKHFREQWSVEKYCKALGITPRRLSFACKHVAGKSSQDLLHERLMREARANLTYSNKSISEIAYALGFKSAAYFSHFHKRNTGISPRQYLQQLTSAK